jgi:hypothetical protein
VTAREESETRQIKIGEEYESMRKTGLVVLALTLVPACAFAVDGVVLISTSTVTAAGGFPFTISQPGSYKLSGNLTPTNQTAIKITTNDVTLDLNGFTISCNSCTTPPCSGFSCTGVLADGILSSGNQTTIINGTITGFIAGNGINFASGGRLTVEHVKSTGNNIGIRGNFGGAILTVVDCEISDNPTNSVLFSIGQGDSGSGISMSGGLVTGSVIAANGMNGIFVFNGSSTITNNLIYANHGGGVEGTFGFGGHQTAIGMNTITNNGKDVDGTTSMGNNVCSIGPC